MKHPIEDLVWPLSRPAEIYLHLAEAADGKGSLTTQQAYQGHALLSMCESFDLGGECGPISKVAKEGSFQFAPVNICGFTLEHAGHGFIFHADFATRIDGALRSALIRLFPDHAGLVEMTRLDSQGAVIRSGMSADDAVNHPFFQALAGLRPEDEAARARLGLRELALEEAGLPPMGPQTRARIWDWLKRESRTEHQSFEALWKWASAFLGPEANKEGRTYLRHAVFFERDDYASGNIAGAAARRLRFLKYFPGAEGLFKPLRPEHEQLRALRDMVQEAAPEGRGGALVSEREISDLGRTRIGAAAWTEFTTDPAGFIEIRQ